MRELFGPQAVDEGTHVVERPTVAKPPSVKRMRKSRIRPAPAVVSPAAFWGDAAAEPKASNTRIEATSTDEPNVLGRAGKFPFWRDEVALADAIVPVYNDAAVFALNWLADRATAPPKK